MMSKKMLQKEIEIVRTELNRALENGKDFDEYYEKSVQLDKLIEKYIDLCEKEQSLI